MHTVEILLATYNAEKYIKEQINSIIAQKEVKWSVLARDDGSKDDTVFLLNEYENQYPECFRVINDEKKGLGACGNFSALMNASSADYVAFCDHDDVWHPNKLLKAINLIKSLERNSLPDKPILVHSDLRVVDENQKEIALSLSKLQKFNLKRGSVFHRLLMQNVVTGCTMVVNRALINKCGAIPLEAVMHDHWLALIAAAFGKIGVINGVPEIDYRQHSKNTIGAKPFSHFALLMAPERWSREKLIESLQQTYQQAKVFSDKYKLYLPEKYISELNAFLRIYKSNWFVKRFLIIKYGFWKHGLLRNIGLFLHI